MDSFQSILGDAAGGALCNVLSAYGASAPLLTAIGLLEPTPGGEALAIGAGLAGLAANVGCGWDPNGDGPTGPSEWPYCRKFTGIGVVSAFNPLTGLRVNLFQFVEITGFESYLVEPAGKPSYIEYKWYYHMGGNPKTARYPVANEDHPEYLSDFQAEPANSGDTCVIDAPPGPPPEPPVYVHTDPASGCEINVSFKGWAQGPAGDVGGVWQMEPATPQTRASGGIIGGCNFAPTIYYDGGGGGGGSTNGPASFPVPDPVPPDTGEPWWAPLLRSAAGGAGAALVNKALEELFETPYPAGSYSINGVCERDPDGNPMDVTRSSTYLEAPGIDAVLTRLDALADLFQYHKELRQPICRAPRGGGDLVTVNFVSDAPSPQGEKRLRKFLRYRDQSNTDLAVHGAHWRDFSWQAGPVCVCHKGGPWGVLQVWAVSADEGKRVIRHAGAVAGVDPDSQGEWLVTGSSDPRYGQPGTMRVERRVAGELRQDFLRVTKRSDPNGLPLLPAA